MAAMMKMNKTPDQMQDLPQSNADETVPPLRLLAKDNADIEVVSALLQDAIIPGADMLYDHGTRCFIFIANRFCWERPPLAGVTAEDGHPVHERSLCGVRIEGVHRVLQNGMPARRQMALLNLLAITSKTSEDDRVEINLTFSGAAALRLIVDDIDVIVQDVEASHPTMQQPQHALD